MKHERTFNLALDDETYKALLALAAQDSTTPERILTGFVNDLVGGYEDRNGSDEADLARTYYDRVGYSDMAMPTFTGWILSHFMEEDAEYMANRLERAKAGMEELANGTSDAEDLDEERIYLDGELEETETFFRGVYRQYNGGKPGTDEAVQDAIGQLMSYFKSLRG